MNNGFIPSLEFAQPAEAYIDSPNTIRMGGTGVTSGYQDNRCDPLLQPPPRVCGPRCLLPLFHFWSLSMGLISPQSSAIIV